MPKQVINIHIPPSKAFVWYENGKKYQESMWRDGEWQGMETLWYANGKKEYEIYYLASKAYARIEWDEEGKVRRVEFPTALETAKSKSTAKSKGGSNNKRKK